jgi:hypothetical protein
MMAQLPDISIQNRQQAELTNWNDNPSRGKQSGISATTGNKLRQLTDFATLPSSSKAPKRREAAQAALAKISPVFAIKRDAARTLITDTVRASWNAMYRSLPRPSNAPAPMLNETEGYTDHRGRRTQSREKATDMVTGTVVQWTNRCKCGHLCRTLEGLKLHWDNNTKCRQARPANESFDSSYVQVQADSQDEQRWHATLATVRANVQILVELWPVFTEETYRSWFTGLCDIRREERDLCQSLPVRMRRLRGLNRELSAALGIHTDDPLLDLCTRLVRVDWEDTIEHSLSAAASENAADLEELETVRALEALLAREEQRLAPIPSGQDNSTGLMMRLSRTVSDSDRPDVECALLMRLMKPDVFME